MDDKPKLIKPEIKIIKKADPCDYYEIAKCLLKIIRNMVLLTSVMLILFFGMYVFVAPASICNERDAAYLSSFSQEDMSFIDYIGKSINPPSDKPLNVTEHIPRNYVLSQNTLLMTYIYKFLQKQLETGGFYVEIGAGNGQYVSTTLRLDKVYHWKGLLIEPNDAKYKSLLNTNRHAYTGNFCISPKPQFVCQPLAIEPVDKNEIESNSKTSGRPPIQEILNVPCYPLHSVLAAIGRTDKSIDFLSIKTNGTELDVLKTIPEIIIKVLHIDHRNITDGYRTVKNYFDSSTYALVEDIMEDEDIVGSIYVNDAAIFP